MGEHGVRAICTLQGSTCTDPSKPGDSDIVKALEPYVKYFLI